MISFAKGAAFLGFQHIVENSEASQELHQKFQQHMVAEGLSYGTREEYEFRFEIFKAKDAEIEYWNNNQNDFVLGHGPFSTKTEDEAKAMMGFTPIDHDMEPTLFDDSNLTAGKDWRNGGITAVKNQGSCGSCWSFGATAGTENAHFRAAGELLTLSEE